MTVPGCLPLTWLSWLPFALTAVPPQTLQAPSPHSSIGDEVNDLLALPTFGYTTVLKAF